MLEFIKANGIYLLAGIVVVFVLVTFLLSRKPEKVKQENKDKAPEPIQSEPVINKEPAKETPVKTETKEEVKVEEPVSLKVDKPVEVIKETPVIEPKPVEVKSEPKPVVEPKQVNKESKPKVEKKEVTEPKPKVEKKEIVEPIKESEPEIDEDADEEAALKRIVKNPKYHISMNKDEASPYFKKWRVRKEGSTKTIKYFDTQKLAIEYAQDLAEKANTGVVIHKVDGSIRKQDYSKK